MKYKHWFFDLDGTLARTGEDIVVAWKGALTALGRDLTNSDKVFRIGPTLEKVVYELYDDATPQLVEDLMARFKPLYDESGFPNTAPYPGVPELLAAIKASGGKAYIVTNKWHNATQLLRRSSDGTRCWMASGVTTPSGRSTRSRICWRSSSRTSASIRRMR